MIPSLQWHELNVCISRICVKMLMPFPWSGYLFYAHTSSYVFISVRSSECPSQLTDQRFQCCHQANVKEIKKTTCQNVGIRKTVLAYFSWLDISLDMNVYKTWVRDFCITASLKRIAMIAPYYLRMGLTNQGLLGNSNSWLVAMVPARCSECFMAAEYLEIMTLLPHSFQC